MNYLDYYLHKIYEPSYLHRQYENDIPKPDKGATEDARSHYISRAVHIALPFFSLYQPLNSLFSLTMGSVRLASQSIETLRADTHSSRLYHISQTALATLALGAAFYQYTLGLALTSCVDITTNIYHLTGFLYQGEYHLALEETLQALGSSMYLGIMVTGSLEIVLASILVQSVLNFYQAKEEWAKGNTPEALAKMVMGCIRGHHARGSYHQIQRRNQLYKEYAQLVKNIERGRKIDHLWDHPLVNPLDPNHPLKDLPYQIDTHRTELESASGEVFDFGSYFYGYGKQTVKGMNITFKQEGEKTTLDFKINHVFRDRLQQTVEQLSTLPKKDLQDLYSYSGSHCKGLEIRTEDMGINPNGFYMGQKYHIIMEGLGSINIGASPEVLTLYDKIHVEMDKGKSLYDFHEALSLLRLDDTLRQAALEDMEKMKLGMLYRTFYPTDATIFERDPLYFDLNLADFKQEILLRSPGMKDITHKYLDKMVLREILPGRMRFAIEGLSDELISKGAWGLTTAITGAATEEAMFDRVASIIKMGMISSEMRNEQGLNKQGLSWGLDYYTGGADSVFTQIVTENMHSFDASHYWGDIRLNFSPKVLETGTYQYHDDSFGTRILNGAFYWENQYLARPNIFDFTKVENFHYAAGNEVMVKDRIPPDYITSIVVKDEIMKNQLLAYLREQGLVKIDLDGQETLMGKIASSFIFAGAEVKKEQFIQ